MVIKFKAHEMESLLEVKKTIEDLILIEAKREARTQGFTQGVNFILENKTEEVKK